MEPKFCQSCGMPMEGQEYGTEKDGRINGDYCGYCYQIGAFTFEGTLDEMIEICVPHMAESGMGAEEARKMMREFMPSLKRWRT